MSRPIRFIPEEGSLVEITCRTDQGRYLLRPDPVINDILLGVLGRAQRLYPVEICAFSFNTRQTPVLGARGLFDRPSQGGYTQSMKTAVSIPDDVFEEAERLAMDLQTSRSQLYSRALQEFVARHAPDRLTEAMNRVVDEVGNEIDEFSQRASRRVLEQVEW